MPKPKLSAKVAGLICGGLSLLLIALPLKADISIAQRYIDQPHLAGEGRMKVMLWNVFDAQLYAQDGEFDPNAPFALSLSYLRKLNSAKIVKTTIEEMRKQGQFTRSELDQWGSQLSQIIPNVGVGTTITGVRDSAGSTILYEGADQIGKLQDQRFTNGFFNIWLGEQTRNQALRNRLVGASGKPN